MGTRAWKGIDWDLGLPIVENTHVKDPDFWKGIVTKVCAPLGEKWTREQCGQEQMEQ